MSKRSALALNRSYNFVDKAEIIDTLRTRLDDAGFTVASAANKSGVCQMTLRNWFDGKTKRPQLPTLNAVGRLVGMKLAWTPTNR
jgi:hypothetical protein